jgi:hypothetical protein
LQFSSPGYLGPINLPLHNERLPSIFARLRSFGLFIMLQLH